MTMKKMLMGMMGALLMLTAVSTYSQDQESNTQTAIFAGGCFWCTESDFEKLDGVIGAVSGYTAGHADKPTYKQVSSGSTGHTEAVEVTYDSARISYAELVEFFWRTIDPTQANAQFCDHGSQYRTAIYFQNDEEEAILSASRQALDESKPFDAPIVTEIQPRQKFWVAEGYHQDYYKKSAYQYKLYRFGCGRDTRLKSLWGAEIKGD
jgi:peptide-methionine (S)-S-oxide reductase